MRLPNIFRGNVGRYNTTPTTTKTDVYKNEFDINPTDKPLICVVVLLAVVTMVAVVVVGTICACNACSMCMNPVN